MEELQTPSQIQRRTLVFVTRGETLHSCPGDLPQL